MPETTLADGVMTREFSVEELIELNKMYREAHEAMNHGSVFQKAPDLLLEAINFVNSLAVTTRNSRGEKDSLYINLDRTSKNMAHAYRYMIDVAMTYQDNKSIRNINSYMQERINRLEARLVVYEVIETAMNEGTLDETIKIIKAKMEAKL